MAEIPRNWRFLAIFLLVTVAYFWFHPEYHLHSSSRSRCGSSVPQNHDGSWKIPLKYFRGFHPEARPLYLLNFTLGCPPQPFTGILSLDPYFKGSPLDIHSAHCENIGNEIFTCPTEAPTYDHEKSWSYRSGSDQNLVQNFGVIRRGRESIDILTVGGLQVSNQRFREWTSYDSYADDRYKRDVEGKEDNKVSLQVRSSEKYKWITHWATGIIFSMSMLPPEFQAKYGVQSPFQTMVNDGILRRNLFSLTLPKNETEEGYLTLYGGSTSVSNRKDLISHPLFPADTVVWSIAASSISVTTPDIMTTDEKPPVVHLDQDVSGYRAMFVTSSRYLYFPEPLYSQIISALEIQYKDSPGHFPALKVGLGGQIFTFQGRDYGPLLRKTHSARIRLEQPDGSFQEPEWMGTTILLGSTFLEKVLGVFDWDERSISPPIPA